MADDMNQGNSGGTGRGWFGDPQGHREAGREGGMSQGMNNNPGNFANDRVKASRAGRKGGKSRRKSR